MFVRMCLNCRMIPMPICHLSLSKLPSTLCGQFKLSALQLFGLKDHDFRI